MSKANIVQFESHMHCTTSTRSFNHSCKCHFFSNYMSFRTKFLNSNCLYVHVCQNYDHAKTIAETTSTKSFQE